LTQTDSVDVASDVNTTPHRQTTHAEPTTLVDEDGEDGRRGGVDDDRDKKEPIQGTEARKGMRRGSRSEMTG